MSSFNKMNQMKKISDTLSPLGWITITLCSGSTIAVVLQPTFVEFVVMIIADALTYAVLIKNAEFFFFKKLYPDVIPYFDVVNVDDIQINDLDERAKLLESFSKFPQRRALYAYLGSFIKVIPAFLIMIFYWKHDVSNSKQFLILTGISFLHFCYFYSAIFIESHYFLSAMTEKLHKKYDYSDAFRKLKYDYSRGDLLIQEALSFSFIILFMLGSEIILIFVHSESGSYRNLGYKLIVVGLDGLVLLLRIWYLGRNYLVNGLESIFKKAEDLGFSKKEVKLLPVHSLRFLRKFDQSFNFLTDRLKQSEKELTLLVTQEVDKSRFRALGEISALIAHDMSGPAHAVQFCLSQFKESQETEQKEKYIHHLEKNLNRLIELLNTIKARLKNPNGGKSEKRSNFFEAHQYVVSLLETQFKENKFHRIKFKLSENINSLELEIKRVDLIHILDNLYRNCVENLIKTQVVNPIIEIQYEIFDDKKVKMNILDNGMGLSSEKFESLTSYSFSTVQENFHEGLGMRLVRRLIEHNDGSLIVLDQPPGKVGTLFQLKLNLA